MTEWKPIDTFNGIEFVDMVLLCRQGKDSTMPEVWSGEHWLALSLGGTMEYKNPTHFTFLPEPLK